MKKKILLSLIVFLVTASSTPAAIIIEVPSAPYPTIQAGIDAAASGDTVLIHPGTYTGDGNRDIDFNGKSITVRSENPSDPCVVAATIIDCDGTEAEPHRGFNFSNNQDCNAVIDGLTIINGCVNNSGGAIDCRNNQASSLLISNCNINNNTVLFGRGSSGGGISVIDGIYLINNCMISNNTTEQGGGGGISCEDSTLTISNSIISENINGGIRCVGSNLSVHNCKIHSNSQAEFPFSGATAINCGDSDVTITNSSISDNLSGGIGCYDSNTTILNCSISGNKGREGGGIHCTRGSSIISNCKISANTAPDCISENGGYGGGIHCDEGSSIISNCKINSNAGGEGGGIHCTRGSSVISNCKISGNTARYFTPMGYGGYGGGIYCDGSSSTIKNCTFTGNLSFNGKGLVCYSWSGQYPSNVELSNCILWDGGDEICNDDDSTITVSYSNIEGGWPGLDNIDVDPCFVEPGIWDTNGTPDIWYDDFWVEGDYHLLPGSLCINTGDPCYVPEPNETDLDGNPRITNGQIDMGAYESDYIQARLWLLPRTINRQSKMKRVMAWMQLPEGINKDQIDQNTPLLLYPGHLEPINQYIFEHGQKDQKQTSIFIFYDKAELLSAVPDNGLIDVQVIGSLNTSQQFYGSGSLTIVDRQQPRQRRFLKKQ
jgi:hypothetical protein